MKTKTRPPITPPRLHGSPAAPLRDAIQRAEASGVARKDMVLRLTNRDVSLLKRDSALAVTDISFADGVMRYEGVTVQQGGVAASDLLLPTPAA